MELDRSSVTTDPSARSSAERTRRELPPSLSIVIPAFDEARRIGPTLDATLAFLDARGIDAEILVVDDGSSDRTADVVEERALRDGRVRVLRLPENRGKGFAVRTGVLASIGDRVLFMDADLATPIEELDRLQAALDAGYAVAVGSRALHAENVKVRRSLLRGAMGRSFNAMVRLVAMGGIADTQCGFKLFTRRAASVLFGAATIDRFAFDVEILLLARGRFRVAEVPVEWHQVEGSKVAPLPDALRMGLDVLRLRLRMASARRGARAPRALPAPAE